MLTGDTWYVQINGQVYGPYSTVQMHGFVEEGRIISDSQISTSPDQVFRSASDYKAFNPALITPQLPQTLAQTLELTQAITPSEMVLRPGATPQAPKPAQQNFKPVEYNPHLDENARHYETVVFQPLTPSPQKQQAAVNQLANQDRGQTSRVTPNSVVNNDVDKIDAVKPVNLKPKPPAALHTQDTEIDSHQAGKNIVLLVMAEFRSGHAMGFLKAIQNQGVAQRIGDTVWLLKTQTTVNELRNILSQTMQREDRLFIMDSFNNKTAWFNIGSDMDRRIREFWDMEPARPAS